MYCKQYHTVHVKMTFKEFVLLLESDIVIVSRYERRAWKEALWTGGV